MVRANAVVLLLVVLAVPGCCCPWHHQHEHKYEKQDSGKQDLSYGETKWHDKECQHHQIEPPFELEGGTPGAGIVFATADFNGNGSVLIKVQVEDTDIDGTQAVITVWSGNGNKPTSSGTPPPNSTQVYSSGGPVDLRFWTTHLDRTYDPVADKYWLYVYVDHRDASGNPVAPRHLWFDWTPSATALPDTPHDLNQYPLN